MQVEPGNMQCCWESCTEGGLISIVMENEAPVGEVPVSGGTSLIVGVRLDRRERENELF